MIKKFSVLPLLLAFFSLRAQTIKTDVLVIGNGPSAVAAAIQSARSKAKTVLAAEKIAIAAEGENLAIEENNHIASGIWGEFRNHLKDIYKTTNSNDTAFSLAAHLKKSDAAAILTGMIDTVKTLTMELNTTFASLEKTGDEWDVEMIKDGKAQEIKAKVIIDATENCAIAQKAGAKRSERISLRRTKNDIDLERTVIAAGETWPPQKPEENAVYMNWYIPLKAVVAIGVQNIFITDAILPAGADPNYIPVQLATGQGAGAAAAYCAFFKTNTDHLKVRLIQGELLDFKVCLIPYKDILPGDADWRAIQQVSATNLLRGLLFFRPDEQVMTAGIRPILIDIYSRAFLWFNKEKPGDKFTIGNMLSFISDHTLTDPAILKTGIQKAWKTQFKFQPDFELNRQITRREFAVLANKYLNPFGRMVDLNGRLVN